jgi:2-polyprenyl-6-methoxyphenol hydroxylase-like FAD-dependent oxidoreductase
MKPFLIAGGGIGGFAAALALARHGLESIVIERDSELREAGAGIQLGPNVFRMFEVLGLTEAINEVAVFPDALVMMDALDASEVTRIPLNTPEFKAKFTHPYGVIYRPDLHNAFIEAARATGKVEVRLGEKVTGFEDTGSGVKVSLASGETVEGEALIGADGLWSKVRETIVGDGHPRVSGHIAYRAVLPEMQVPAANHKNEVILWAGPKTHLVHYPLHKGEIFNLVSVFHSDAYEEGWDVYGDVDELNRKFAGQRRKCWACSTRSRAGGCGCCATVSRSRPGRRAGSRCSAMQRTRCCNTWRRVRAWQRKMRFAWRTT